MRIFKDLDLVEHLGSGVPRIIKAYGKGCFEFSENFSRMTFRVYPQVTPQVAPQVTQLVSILSKNMDRMEMQQKLKLSDKKNFVKKYLNPALESGIIEMTIPEKPTSRLQQYRLTALGLQVRNGS